jgi:cytochrome c-type biogenesis protein CcmH/NrfG
MNNLEEKIEGYLLGELNEEERLQFEQNLKKDSELAEKVRDHRQMMERLEAMRLRNKVKSVLEPDAAYLNGSKALQKWMIWALSVLMVALLGWYTWKTNANQPIKSQPADNESAPFPSSPTITDGSPGQEMAQHLENTPKSEESRPKDKLIALALQFHQDIHTSNIRDLSSGQTTQQLKNAADALDQHHYKKVIQLLEQDLEPRSDNAKMLLASAYFREQRFLDAAAIFQSMNNSFQYKNDAEWNLMLCQLSMGETHKAVTFLHSISQEPEAPYHDQANELKRLLAL